MPRVARPMWERVLTNIHVDFNGCWIWQLAIDQGGYGVVSVGAKGQQLAHRASYESLIGPIPEGLHLDHLCRVRRCVNPRHLDPVTPKVNVERSWPATKLHCRHGHELFGPNLQFSSGSRQCRTCRVEASRRRNGYRGPLTECKRGHSFDEANTYIKPDGRRGCRTCRREATRRWQQRAAA